VNSDFKTVALAFSRNL